MFIDDCIKSNLKYKPVLYLRLTYTNAMEDIGILDQVSFISIQNDKEPTYLDNRQIHMLGTLDRVPSRKTNTIESPRIYKTTSTQSLFKRKQRRTGQVTLSYSNLNLAGCQTTFGPQNENDTQTLISDDDINYDSVRLAEKYLPSDFIQTMNDFVLHNQLESETSLLFYKLRKCNQSHEFNQSEQTQINKAIFNLHKQFDSMKLMPKSKDEFFPRKVELKLRQQLGDEKVVPLSNAIFNPSNVDVYKAYQQRNKIVVNSNKPYRTRTRDLMRNCFKIFSSKKHVAASDSAELENQIFSPNTHRPSENDVPGISQMESNEEEIKRTLRSNSTATSLFRHDTTHLSVVSTDIPKRATFRLFKSIFKLRSKPKSSTEIILSPITSSTGPTLVYNTSN